MRAATKIPHHQDRPQAESKELARVEENGHDREVGRAKLRTPLVILALLGIVAFLYVACSVILPIVLAYVGAMVLKPCVVWLCHWNIPRALAALLILGAFFSAIAI